MFKLYTKHDLLIPEQTKYISGVLDFENKTAEIAMTKLQNVYMVEESTRVTDDFIFNTYKEGFSKMPVYSKTRENIIGIIYIKDLLIVKTKKEIMTVRQIMLIFNRTIHIIDADTSLKDVLMMLKTRSSHMGIVRLIDHPPNSDPIYKIIGIITLEDVIEKLLMDEITDVDDSIKKGNLHHKCTDIVNFFTDFSALKKLTPSYIDAICCFLSVNCSPFSSIWFTKENLSNYFIRTTYNDIGSTQHISRFRKS